MTKVIAVETGFYGGQVRYRGQEFEVPDIKKLKWVVEKGKPLPDALKPFVRTIKDLAAQVKPEDGANTMSQKTRQESIADDARRAAKTEQPKQAQPQPPAKTQ